ncbi:MAG: S4 domain-containing protein, partial [Clostridia bacterium]|nr:S4 domain-containing protein [Clostridia bacterium]
MEKIRLQKYLANAGVASRRKAEELIAKGVVSVNGKIVNEVVLVDDNDDIRVNNKPIKIQDKFLYYAFNKPEMVITSM